MENEAKSIPSEDKGIKWDTSIFKQEKPSTASGKAFNTERRFQPRISNFV
jgi:hypothetical protein